MPARNQPVVRVTTVADLTPDPENANRGTERGAAMLETSLRRYGAGRSLLIDSKGVVIAGNKTLEQAGQMGMEDVLVIQTDGTKLVAVQRMDLDMAADPRAREMAFADNRVGQVDLDWDVARLAEALEQELDIGAFFRQEEIDKLVGDANRPIYSPVTGDEEARLARIPKNLAEEEEWQEEARDNAEAIQRRVKAATETLAQADPALLNRALAIAVPLDKGHECLVFVDPMAKDACEEVRRALAAGDDSPLARLFAIIAPL
jgi:hypothetical protein